MLSVNYPNVNLGDVGQSYGLWDKFPLELVKNDRNAGYFVHEDFFPHGGTTWLGSKTVIAAGSAIADFQDADGGVVLFDPGAVTAGDGITFRSGGCIDEATTEAQVEEFSLDATSEFFFEARVKLTTISTAPRFCIGLGDKAAVSGASDVSATNFLGFTNSNGSAYGSGLYGYSEKAGTASRTTASLHTLVTATWVKVGFHAFGNQYVRFYINGDPKYTYDLTQVPETELTVTLSHLAGGTVQPTCAIDWYRVGKSNRLSVWDVV